EHYGVGRGEGCDIGAQPGARLTLEGSASQEGDCLLEMARPPDPAMRQGMLCGLSRHVERASRRKDDPDGEGRGSWKRSRHRLEVALRVVCSPRSPFHTEMRSPS